MVSRCAAGPGREVHVEGGRGRDEGDRRERFRLIYQASYHRILGYALRRASSPEDAADAVAETFLTAWRVLANQRRGERRRSRLADRLREEMPRLMEAADPGTTAGTEAVVRALAQLREEDRDILRLAAWEGLSHGELAEVLGCSPNAAKIRLHRARKRLGARLAASGIGLERVAATGHRVGERVSACPAAEGDR
jgi:RNA polymerase sigma-70 factor (ECF subfamily)